MTRSYVMFDANTERSWVSFVPLVEEDSAFVVASFPELDSAVELVSAIRERKVTMESRPGPWIKWWYANGFNIEGVKDASEETQG